MKTEQEIREHLIFLQKEYNFYLNREREEDVDRCRALQYKMNTLKWILNEN